MSNSSTNSSIPNSQNSTALSILVDPGPIYNSYTIGSFFIGLLITITSSILNAFGINLQKLDLNRQSSSKNNNHNKTPCFKPIWFLGLSLYILSQVLGSTLALQYMRSEYVAPLGSTSLIFNFLFARWLLGTKITMLDVGGTLVVILGVIGVIGFGNIRQAGIDEEANMSLLTLKALWARPAWIIHLITLEILTGFVFWLALIAYAVIQDKQSLKPRPGRRSHAPVVEEDEDEDEDRANVERVLRRGGGRISNKKNNYKLIFIKFINPIIKLKMKFRNWLKFSIEKWSASRPDPSLMKLDGLLWGTSAGLLAGQTLIFAKSYVKLIVNGFDHQGHGEPKDLVNPLSILILFLLLITGVLQVWCLNKGLTVYDSTLIVPVLFATYTGSGFINSLIYLHELPNYRNGVLVMIWLCIGVLVIGVCMLSAKRVENSNLKNGGKSTNEGDMDNNAGLGEYSSSADPEGEVQATAIGGGPRESVRMMTMIDDPKKLKLSPQSKNPFESSLDYSIHKLKNSRHSVFELEDNLPLSSNNNEHDRSFESSDSSSGSSNQSHSRSTSVKRNLSNYDQQTTHFKSNNLNPFEDFEILEAEQAEEEDEIDHLDNLDTRTETQPHHQNDNHDYFHPPDHYLSDLNSKRNPT